MTKNLETGISNGGDAFTRKRTSLAQLLLTSETQISPFSLEYS